MRCLYTGEKPSPIDIMQLTNVIIERAVNRLLIEINAPDTDPRLFSRLLAFWQGKGRRILELRFALGDTKIRQIADFMFETHNRVAEKNGRRKLRRR